MKLSARKKSQIYDLCHEMFVDRRIAIKRDYMASLDEKLANKLDYQFAQLETPLAQAIFKIFEGKQ
jgi:hypothetical protein